MDAVTSELPIETRLALEVGGLEADYPSRAPSVLAAIHLAHDDV